MHVNTRPNNSNANFLFDCFEIKYALLGCLAFTNKTDKLREMLLHVLLCSALPEKKLIEKLTVFDVIDRMLRIICPDYKNCKNYRPAEILYSLDRDSRIILFEYMNNPSNNINKNQLRKAQRELSEKLFSKYGDTRKIRIFQPQVYLLQISDYLTFRLNEISMSIAKEIYSECNSSDKWCDW